MFTLAPYILIIFLASGDVRIVQDLNRDTCHAARDVIHAFTQNTAHAYCMNTLDPLGTP